MSRGLVTGVILMLVVLVASGCAELSQNPKTALGAAGGAAAGGLIGATASGSPPPSPAA